MSSSVDDYDHLYKIILVGDATVGKTHLLSRYTRDALPKTPQPTIGVEFATRTVPLSIGGTVKAQIWDTAGQERYRAITRAHYRRSVGALLVYDITRKSTFLNASRWLEDIRQNSEPNIVVMLVGNKLDLVEKDSSKREVPYEIASNFAEENGLFFSEASAVTRCNVKHIFEHLLQEVYNQKVKDNSSNLDINGKFNSPISFCRNPLIIYTGCFTNASNSVGIQLSKNTRKQSSGCC
ncbi:Rablib [Cryptosporidium xiaoi]|uniref:Rablib n=1 Tax=Cryptosporidium xiaoi TaxID=659607 RepID=A0AAV9XYA5_9CRYT